MNAVRVVVVGCGTMGSSHARAYARPEGFTLAGLVDWSGDKAQHVARELGNVPVYRSLDESVSAARPGAVAICTYPETHPRRP